MRLRSRLFCAASVGAALVGSALALPAASASQTGPDDAVVIAVIDDGFSPYHWDFLAAQMPQHRNADRTDDLPLTKAPHTWLPGFPAPARFDSYQALPITLATADDDKPDVLDGEDEKVWAKTRHSNGTNINYHWIPGTKVVGALSFAAEDASPGDRIHGTTGLHGMGTSSVSVGNIYGTCPECLLVFIQYSGQAAGEQAIEWAMRQSWIDAVTNSYGFSAAYRDRVYSGSNVGAQRTATDRGQTVFFSAGNGQDGAFAVPNSTLLSSQEGPDWIVTVGATAANADVDYTGTGKPADVAGIGNGYPSGYNADTVTGDGEFGGTSNATPTIAGTYGRALYQVRRAMPGKSRLQGGGIVAKGLARCGRARPDCELRDGVLTAKELRLRLFRSARPTAGGFTDPLDLLPGAPAVGDTRFASEGHGTYRARLDGDAKWLAEFDRLAGPLFGRAKEPARPDGEADWFRVDSWCRQHLWGDWAGGYFRDAGSTPLPADDPFRWPTRTALRQSCSGLARQA